MLGIGSQTSCHFGPARRAPSPRPSLRWPRRPHRSRGPSTTPQGTSSSPERKSKRSTLKDQKKDLSTRLRSLLLFKSINMLHISYVIYIISVSLSSYHHIIIACLFYDMKDFSCAAGSSRFCANFSPALAPQDNSGSKRMVAPTDLHAALL